MLKKKIATVLCPSRTGVRRGATVFLVLVLLFGGVGLSAGAESFSLNWDDTLISVWAGHFPEDCTLKYTYNYSDTDNILWLERSDGFVKGGAYVISLVIRPRTEKSFPLYQSFSGKLVPHGAYFNKDKGTNFIATSYIFDGEDGARGTYYEGDYTSSDYGYTFKYDYREKCLDYLRDYILKFEIVVQEDTDRIELEFTEFNLVASTDEELQTDKIIESQKELQEQEREEASQTGDDGVDSVTSAIPDYSGNIISAFQGFVDCFCHSNAENLSLTMPEFNTPTFKGLIPSFKIWDSFSVDFNDITDKYIPEKVLYLARFLLSTAILMWGVYEVYDLIEYFVTLSRRKGD